jgi:Leu/Phe-tRNA-protein transferase
VELIDCQVASDHLFTLGARLIPRAQFVAHLERAIPRAGPAPSANRP